MCPDECLHMYYPSKILNSWNYHFECPKVRTKESANWNFVLSSNTHWTCQTLMWCMRLFPSLPYSLTIFCKKHRHKKKGNKYDEQMKLGLTLNDGINELLNNNVVVTILWYLEIFLNFVKLGL